MAVKVRGLKVDKRKDIPYADGMTVAQALENAKVTLPYGGTVTVDGKPATPATPVADGAKIVVTPPVENGNG